MLTKHHRISVQEYPLEIRLQVGTVARSPLSDALPILVVVKIPIPFSPPHQCSGHINYFHTAQLVPDQRYLEQVYTR